MWQKIKNTAVIVLATLGVLFIILMLIPDSEDDEEPAQTAVETEAESSSGTEDAKNDADGNETAENETAENEAAENEAEENEGEENEGAAEVAADNETEENEAADDDPDDNGSSGKKDEEDPGESEGNPSSEGSGNTVSVEIPSSDISDYQMKFKATTLDGKKVTNDIFSDYDITVVHVWGTFCMPCIAEMGDYARFYEELPDNVNLIGIVSDVYDGLDNNVDAAKEILGDADAKFMNLKTSDSIYEVTESISFIPSSFLVDREGHIIGGLLEGAHFNDTVKVLNEYIKK